MISGSEISAIMNGRRRDASAKLLRPALTCLSSVYRLVIATRNYTFNRGLRSSVSLPRTTISVGNITAGGTGKTPIVIELAGRLAAMGQKPGVLLRGYARTEHGSDEQMELQASLGDDMAVVADPDRVAGARRLIKRKPDTTILIMDDGFQHRQVSRALDIVLIDATEPFGYDRLLPRGLLREPPYNIRRADAVIVTRANLVDEDTLAEIDNRIADLTGDTPLAHCDFHWQRIRDGNEYRPVNTLKNLRVAGVCAVGNPDAFDCMLRQAAGEMLWCEHFPDHHPYQRDEIIRIFDRAVTDHAQAVIITEKDWLKWRPLLSDSPPPVPVYRPEISVRFIDGEQALHARLRKTISRIH